MRLNSDPAREAPRRQHLANEPRRPWRVLVADDSRDHADSLSELLRLARYEVVTAYDGDEALALAAEFEPAVVLLDLDMPRLNGIETCRRLRAMPTDEGMIIIALTGWGRSEDRQRTRAAGFDAHLAKPVDPNRLLDLIHRLGEDDTLPA